MTSMTKRIYQVSGKGYFSFLLLGAALVPLASAQAQSGANALSGQYAFYLSGQEKLPAGGSALEAIAGSFNADGQGHITSGVLDKNSETGPVQVSGLTGVYSLNATTGKGQVTLNLPTGPLSLAFYTYLPLPTPNPNYHPIDAAIVAAGGTLLGGSGRLSNAYGPGIEFDSATFTLDGESSSGASAVSGITSFNIPSIVANSTKVTGQAELIENGTASFYPNITGTATATDATGRLTLVLNGLGTGTAHYAVYQGEFSTGTAVFLSLDPHGSSPLLVGTNGANLHSYAIEYNGTENF